LDEALGGTDEAAFDLPGAGLFANDIRIMRDMTDERMFVLDPP
jgi:hypothetical protein